MSQRRASSSFKCAKKLGITVLSVFSSLVYQALSYAFNAKLMDLSELRIICNFLGKNDLTVTLQHLPRWHLI
jgi:hypothetical protein